MKTDFSRLRVALVYDWVDKWGGIERVLPNLRKIFPQAPIFTSFYDPARANWAKIFEIKSSFLNKFRLGERSHELLLGLMPLAFESFSFRDYDLVISITSSFGKGIITNPKTCHICYCLTPTRWLWVKEKEYEKNPGFGSLNWVARKAMNCFYPYLRRWDRIASNRPDFYLVISEEVKRRIEKYYLRSASVLYPPIETQKFKISQKEIKRGYFLVVSRLVPYKRIDLAVKVFNRLKIPLKIIGFGSQLNFLQRMANSNIEFLGFQSDDDLVKYYYNCQAVICPGEEDFGLVSLEAQACGRPVISFRAGGALETIREGVTGEFFDSQDEESLFKAVVKFRWQDFRPQECRKNALRFSEKIFINNFRKEAERLWRKFQKT